MRSSRPGGAGRWILVVVGILALGTGLASRCLLYVPFGIGTCKVD